MKNSDFSTIIFSTLACRFRLGVSALAALLIVFSVAATSAQGTDKNTGEMTEKLFEAVRANDIAAVQSSIAAGANIDATNDWGLRPVDMAVDKGFFDIAHLLLSIRNVRRATEAQRSKRVRQQATALAKSPFGLSQSSSDTRFVPKAVPRQSVVMAPLSTPPAVKARPGVTNPFDPNSAAVGSDLTVVNRTGSNLSAPQKKIVATPQKTVVAAPQKKIIATPQKTVVATPQVASASAPRVTTADSPAPAKTVIPKTVIPKTVLPKTGPSTAPTVKAATAPAPKSGLIDKFFNTVTNLFNKDETPKKTVVAKSPPAKQVAKVAPKPQKPQKPTPPPVVANLPANYLKGIKLSLGKNISLWDAKPSKAKIPCVAQHSGASTICIQPVQWTGSAASLFSLENSSPLYSGSKSLVRYDQGRATRFHVLFRTDRYDEVVAYFQSRFGPATGVGVRSISSPGIRKDNPVSQWVSVDPASSFATVLEIRTVDDVRGGLPDARHGAVMLMPWQDAPDFARRSILKLMLANAGR